jgi:imidazolonepropionase-like amidohydrolase
MMPVARGSPHAEVVVTYRFEGTVLPSGERREVFVDGGLFCGPVDGAETVLTDCVLLPGLVDVHAHLSLASPAGDDAPPRERVLASARAQRDAGVCALREPGGPDHASTGLGPADGAPRVVTAGRFLAPRGRYVPGLAREVEAEALPDAAVEELRAGGGSWAKVIGDFPEGAAGLTRTYPAEALAETARRVHAAGGRVAVHGTLPEVLQDAIEAGFDSLEHGSFLHTDQIPAAVAAGTAWVPTRTIDAEIRGLVRETGAPEAVVREVERGLDHQPEVLCAAVDAGLTVLAGTDAGLVAHGLVATEVALLVQAGIDPLIALGSASWTARSWLGLPGMEPGAPADLVAYRDDPRSDVDVLTAPTLVLLDGRIVVDRR